MSAKPDNNKPHDKPPSARGRSAASKPLTASTISSSAKAKPIASGSQGDKASAPRLQKTQSTGAASASRTTTTTKVAAKSSSLNRITPAPAPTRADARLKTSGTKAPPSAAPKSEESTFTVTKIESRTVILDKRKNTPAVPEQQSQQTPLPAPVEEQPNSDSLQVAAQAYPWLYMTSTLEACFKSSEEAALKDIELKEKELAEQEGELQDPRLRFEAERAIEFYEELGSDRFAKTAPAIMQSFHTHGEACARIEAEALQLALHGPSEPDEDAPLQIYHDMMDNLEKLHAEALDLESSIVKLTSTSTSDEEEDGTLKEDKGDKQDAGQAEEPSARSQIVGVIAACLPVIRARLMNLSMAQELIDSAQENLSISLRMESLGLAD